MKLASLVLAVAFSPLALACVQAQEAPKLILQFDTVRGGGPTAQGPACVLNSQFKRKESVVWRVRITDPKTGKELDDKAVKELHIELSNGEKVPMSFHGHPPRVEPTDHFWSGGWIVPENHPTGSFTYTVVATDSSGAETKVKPFNVASSQLTVVGN
jgi:hypothetical protein